MSFFDSMNPKDGVDFNFRSKDSDQLPAMMQCPQGHVTHRELHVLSSGTKIPYYVCDSCLVVFRYQELKLVPGDEGMP